MYVCMYLCMYVCMYGWMYEGDREMAAVWIRIWDDASNDYKELIKKGYDYTEL